MRKTKIICTMGPSTDKPGVLKELIMGGMNVARLNFSHGSHEEHGARMKAIKSVREECGKSVAIMLDTKGPEIRVRDFADGKVLLENGQDFTLTADDSLGDNTHAAITFTDLYKDVKAGTNILIDDGLIEMMVKEIKGTDIVCTVVNGGYVSNHKGVNVPGAHINMDFLSDIDKSDILFGIEQDVDFIAASFVRCADDVRQIRKLLDDNGGKGINIISKIENQEGLDNIDEIIDASDAIMVARGDMGVELPEEEVPIAQKVIIKKVYEAGKQVITATQMLDSMIRNPGPTRAEVTDVANAILDGTDAIMLSGETAVGKFPVEAVKMMCEIAVETEQYFDYEKYASEMESHMKNDISNVVAYSSMHAAKSLKAKFIITPSISGFTAKIISKYRPQTPVIGMSPNERTLRRMQIYWGVYPLASTKIENEHALIERSINILKNLEYVKKDDTIVITAGVAPSEDMPEVSGNTNTMRVSLIN